MPDFKAGDRVYVDYPAHFTSEVYIVRRELRLGGGVYLFEHHSYASAASCMTLVPPKISLEALRKEYEITAADPYKLAFSKSRNLNVLYDSKEVLMLELTGILSIIEAGGLDGD